MIDNEKIGKFIAARRKSKGLTQSALAELLGLSNKAVSKWETGEGLPDISLLPQLADALDVSVDELLSGEKKESESIKVEEVANEKNLLNLFNISFIISMFSVVFGALLGGFTNIYCFRHFSVLFYTHWEIIFDAVSFTAIVFGNLLFYVSAMRLNVRREKDEIVALSYKKALALLVVSSVFILSFLMRVANRYIDLPNTVAGVTALLGLLTVVGAAFASRKFKKRFNDEKKDH